MYFGCIAAYRIHKSSTEGRALRGSPGGDLLFSPRATLPRLRGLGPWHAGEGTRACARWARPRCAKRSSQVAAPHLP